MPAQREETILSPHPLQAQHLREHLAHDLLNNRGRPPPPRPRATVVRHRQRRLVQLAVHRHRQRRQHHHRRRHHVIRQPPRRVPAHQPGQPFGTSTAAVPAVPVTGWDDIADQPLITRGVLPDRHHRLRHPRMRRQHRLHLTRLHPEPPDLHLIINTPAEHQLPIRGPPHHIPGPVHPLPTTTKRARHKPLRRQTRPPPLTPPPTPPPPPNTPPPPPPPTRPPRIPPRHPHPRHIQLPRHPHRHRAQPPIQHKHPHIRQRRPDHAAATTRRTPRVHHPIRHIHRRLGRPIHVDQHRPTATPCLPPHQPPRIQRLPRQNHPPQRQPPPRPPVPRIGLRQLIKRRRRLAQHRHPLPHQQPQQLPRRPRHPKRHHHQPPPMHQRPKHLPHRHIKRERMEPRPHLTPGKPEPLTTRPQQPHHTAVTHRNTLRHPRRPRRIHHIHRMLRQQPTPTRTSHTDLTGPAAPRPGQPHPPPPLISHQHRHRHLTRPRQHRQPRRIRHNHRRARISQHEPDPPLWRPRVHRHIRRPRLHHPQQRRHQPARAAHHHRHHPLWPRWRRRQPPRQPPRRRIQRLTSYRRVPAHHRHCSWRPRHPRRDQLRHRHRRHRTRGVIPPRQHQPPLGLPQDLELMHPDQRVSRHRRQHHDKPPRDHLRSSEIEQIRRDGDRPPQPGRPALLIKDFAQGEVQVELRPGRADGQHGRVHASQLQRRRGGVLHRQHHLELRFAGQRPRRVQHLHQPLERHILMRQSAQPRLPHPPQQLGERRIPRHIGAQHQRVHEKPGQLTQRLIGPPRHRRPHRNVLTRTQPR